MTTVERKHILLREAQEGDMDALEMFTGIPGFINLANKDILAEQIRLSCKSFSGEVADPSAAKYIFVAEDPETGSLLGTSMVSAKHGTEESPHFYFEVGSEQKFSSTINTGFIHGTLHLKFDQNGPAEIGGLVINPDFRRSDLKIGRQIAFVRFLFIAVNRDKFKNKILAELLPPLNKRGQSPLWEAIGRRFTNMDYWEADQLCQKDKEFILSLFPDSKIYTTFFSAEARNSIGRVGKDTQPAYHMLTKIGFKYLGHVDPFDGGPHLWADTDTITPIKQRCLLTYIPSMGSNEVTKSVPGLLCKAKQIPGTFRAMSSDIEIQDKTFRFSETEDRTRACGMLGIQEGDEVNFSPYY